MQLAPFSEQAGRPAGMQQAGMVLQAGSRQAAGSSRQAAGRQQADSRQAAGRQSTPKNNTEPISHQPTNQKSNLVAVRIHTSAIKLPHHSSTGEGDHSAIHSTPQHHRGGLAWGYPPSPRAGTYILYA